MARTRTRAFVTGALPHTPAWLALIGLLLAASVASAWWALNRDGGALRVPRRVLLRRRLHRVAEAAHLAQHRRSAAWPAASPCWPAPPRWTRRSAPCRCCSRWCCSCGRRRTSGAWRSPTGPTTPPPACRCCRWWWATRAPRASCSGAPLALVAASLLPVFFGAGPIYLAGALAGGLFFLRKAHAPRAPRPAARRRWVRSSRRCCNSAWCLPRRASTRCCARAADALPPACAPTDAARPAGRARPGAARAGPRRGRRRTPQPALDPAAALRASQAAIGRTIGDYTLLDREGRPVRLASYRGKPLLVNFIYTGCFQVCPTSTRALLEALQAMRGSFGDEPVQRRQHRLQPARRFAAGDEGVRAAAAASTTPNWEFLSPHAASVAALTRDFGFEYAADAQAGFDHLLQVSIVDAEGRLVGPGLWRRLQRRPARRAAAPAAARPAAAAAAEPGRTSSNACACCARSTTRATGTYRVSYALAFEIAGGITFAIAMLWFFALEWRDRRRARRALRAASMPRPPAVPTAH